MERISLSALEAQYDGPIPPSALRAYEAQQLADRQRSPLEEAKWNWIAARATLKTNIAILRSEIRSYRAEPIPVHRDYVEMAIRHWRVSKKLVAMFRDEIATLTAAESAARVAQGGARADAVMREIA